MSQCVPSWDLDNNPSSTARLTLHALSNSDSTAADDPTSDYEVAELIWANGQLALQGLGHPRIVTRPIPSLLSSKYSSWSEKPRAGGTLESIVNQAAQFVPSKSLSPVPHCDNVTAAATHPWFNPHHTTTTTTAPPHPITMDALVPCSHPTPIPSTAAADDDPSSHVPNPDNNGIGTYVGSCSVAGTPPEVGKQISLARKRARVARVNTTTAHEGNSNNHSTSASASVSMQDARLDTCDVELDTTSLGSRDNTSSGKPWPSSTKPTTVDDHDSVCHSRSNQKREAGEGEERKKSQSGKSSVKTKRSRAAAIHNQSERKRRDKINERMKTLQKLIPNSSKTDKASMLDEVIEYLKQLQAQVQMMSRMIPQMMLPMTMQQQLQMSMMAQMAGMGMGMGMGIGMGVMDMNMIGRSNMPGFPPILPPTAFMPLASWDVSGDHRLSTSNATMPDPLSSFLACQSQPMTMDTYSRMAALFQQFHPPPTSNAKT